MPETRLEPLPLSLTRTTLIKHKPRGRPRQKPAGTSLKAFASEGRAVHTATCHRKQGGLATARRLTRLSPLPCSMMAQAMPLHLVYHTTTGRQLVSPNGSVFVQGAAKGLLNTLYSLTSPMECLGLS